jgi:hypothetical protein
MQVKLHLSSHFWNAFKTNLFFASVGEYFKIF